MGEELLYLNGRFMPLAEGSIGIEDRGFQLGDGVYEVVKIMNGRPIWLQEHLERLQASLNSIGMGDALEAHALEQVVGTLLKRAKVGFGSLYIQVTRGACPRDFEIPKQLEPTVLAYARELPAADQEKLAKGVVVHPVEDERWAHCDIKSIDLLAAVLAKNAAKEAGADEVLFMGPDGIVREAGSSNVFAFLRGVLRTHPADNRILNGITRRHVIELAKAAGIKVQEIAFTLTELFSEDDVEVFIASTLKDVTPVVRIGDRTVGYGKPGKLTLGLVDLFRDEQARIAGLQSSPA